MAVKINSGSSLTMFNLTPMIDCVFLLLIFFLVASQFAEEERELKVSLPVASTARPLSVKPRTLIVNIDQEGRYFVEGRFVDAAQLEDMLRRASEANPGRQSVVVRADKRCQWQPIITAFNLCNRAGIRDYTPAVE